LVDLLSEACRKFNFRPHEVSQPFADFLADGLAVYLVDIDRVTHGGTLVPVNPAKNQIECLETLAHDAFLDAAMRSLGRGELYFSDGLTATSCGRRRPLLLKSMARLSFREHGAVADGSVWN
jgi:hypothetical protein